MGCAPSGVRRTAALALGVLLLAAAACCTNAGFELSAEQESLLEQLQQFASRHQRQHVQHAAAGSSSSSSNAARRLAGLMPPLLLPTPDKPSIDIFSWPYAATMEDFVLKSGYPLENHKVITPDGFILNMYRIPHGKYRHTEYGNKPVVLLQHGVTLASNSFVLLNANESMAYILADAGFDVWMSNTRGNTYSRGHKWKHEFGQNYWRFSMDEMALIDLPLQIDMALAVSGAHKLGYVGHSQGSTLMYMLLSEKTEYNNKVSVVVHLGPVGFIEYIRAPFLKAQPKVKSDQWLKNAPLGEFLAHRDLSPFIQPFCRHNKTFNEWCVQQLNGMFYGPSVFIPTVDYYLVGTTWPSTVASRNLEHWSQMDRDGVLAIKKYDFGNDCKNLIFGGDWPRSYHESCNQVKYGSDKVPEYDLSKITVPQVFLLGTIDIMSTPEDVAEQQRRFNPNVTVVQVVYNRYSHMDFVWDRNALHKTDLVDLLFRFCPGTF